MKIILMLAFLVSLFSCSDSSEVTLVKNGALESCPNVTVETMVNGYIGNPKWESLVADDNNHYVNVSGTISYEDKEAKALVQFRVLMDNSTFEFYAFEINNEPMGEEWASILVNNMCESATHPEKIQSVKHVEENPSDSEYPRVSFADLFVDFDDYIDKKVIVGGYLFVAGDNALLYQGRGEASSLVVEVETLSKEERKFLLSDCSSGCDANLLVTPSSKSMKSVKAFAIVD